MKTYLVTGGAGFIGSNYILQLLSSQEPMHVINLDALTYAGNLENLQSVENDPRYEFIHGNICDEPPSSAFFPITPSITSSLAAESHVTEASKIRKYS